MSISVHGGIRHLESKGVDENTALKVHGGIRHLEKIQTALHTC